MSDETPAPEETITFAALDADAVTFTVGGVASLPAGTVITLTLTVGRGGEVVVAPPAAVPTEKRRYFNGGR